MESKAACIHYFFFRQQNIPNDPRIKSTHATGSGRESAGRATLDIEPSRRNCKSGNADSSGISSVQQKSALAVFSISDAVIDPVKLVFSLLTSVSLCPEASRFAKTAGSVSAHPPERSYSVPPDPRMRVPASIAVVPVYAGVCESVRVPVPVFFNEPAPERTPENSVSAELFSVRRAPSAVVTVPAPRKS